MTPRRVHAASHYGAWMTACGRDPTSPIGRGDGPALAMTYQAQDVTCRACLAAELRRAARPLGGPMIVTYDAHRWNCALYWAPLCYQAGPLPPDGSWHMLDLS